ncbi:MAG TPA: amino acid permease [Burkholderiaceae bacterium]|nr:amino acid permease [Burkholderiaceae bacterium]
MDANIKKGKTLSVMSVGLMTAAAVVTSLRGLPLLAKEEMTMFVYLAFTVIFYLIPASLVSAELGGAFANKEGGMYTWVKEAFGSRWGFLAIWLQWIQNVVWYPVALTFGAAAIAYMVNQPGLASNGMYVGLFCIVFYWVATWIVLQGVEVFAKIANWGFLIGTILPGLVLLGLLAYWIGTGHALAWNHITEPTLVENGHARFWPEIHGFGTIAFLAGIVLLFAGVEVQAVHVMEMRNPSRGYPAAIGLGALVSVLIFALGALPIAAILPYEKISLQSAVFDTFGAVITDIWHMGWLVSVLSMLVAIGAVSGVLAWLGSPSKGLLETAKEGELPPVLQAKNKNGMPTHILFIQGLIVTVISCFYFVIPDVSVVFFLISAMTIALYLIAYMLMYAAAIKLRYSAPTLERPFTVPGGMFGMWLTAGIGLVGVIFSFIVSFVPPDQLPIGSPGLYVGLVVLGTVLFAAVPLIIHHMRKSSWKST